MTTDNGRFHALKQIVERTEVGGYTLPTPLTDAYDLTVRLSTLSLEPPPAHVHDEAAADVLAVVVGGETPDVVQLGARCRIAADQRADVDRAQRILATAIEQAQYAALGVVQRLADDIITDHLRPVFEANLEQAQRNAAVLAGHATDAASLITAPAKVRAAWAGVRDAGERYRLQRQVWNLVNIAGVRAPEHDVQGQFASLRNPMRLFPGHPLQAPMPQIPFPEPPVELALWLVGDAAVAKPWLPTVAEQDQAWLVVYGEQVARLRAGHDHALAVAGR